MKINVVFSSLPLLIGSLPLGEHCLLITAHWAVILLGFSKKFFRHKEKFFNRAFSWEVDCCSGSLKSSLKMRKPRSTVYQKEVSILFKSLIHHLNLNISCQVISQVKYFGQSHRPPMHRSHLMSIFVSVLTVFLCSLSFSFPLPDGNCPAVYCAIVGANSRVLPPSV